MYVANQASLKLLMQAMFISFLVSVCTLRSSLACLGFETHDGHRDRHTPSLFEAFNVPAMYVAIWAVLMDPCDVSVAHRSQPRGVADPPFLFVKHTIPK